MDVGLGPQNYIHRSKVLMVLILVLVDVGLGLRITTRLCGFMIVLILVLVDVGLGHADAQDMIPAMLLS